MDRHAFLLTAINPGQCPLLAQSRRILHNHLLLCSHSLNERRYLEHMQTAVHDSFHILNPPTTIYNVSNLENELYSNHQSGKRVDNRVPFLGL